MNPIRIGRATDVRNFETINTLTQKNTAYCCYTVIVILFEFV